METRTKNKQKLKGVPKNEQKTSKERVKKHREKLKSDPLKYEEAKKKDKARKTIERHAKKMELLSNEHALKEEKEKQKLRMRKYRAEKKQKEQNEMILSRTSARKEINRKNQKGTYKLKIKLNEIRKVNEVKRVQAWRKSKKEATENQLETTTNKSPYTNRQAEYRDTRKVKEVLPATPQKRAHIVKKLTKSPRTKQHLILDGTISSNENKEEQLLISSIKKSIEKIKPKGTSKEESRSAYKTVTQLIKNIPKAGKLKKRLGINKNMKKPINSEWWANEMRKKRKDRIKDEIKSEIREFYMSPEISREVPVKRECLTVVDRDIGLRTTVQKQVMIMTHIDAYKKYVESYGKKVGFTSFKNIKPANVRRISETNRRTCLCTICANVALKVESISKHLKSKLKSEQSENLKKLSKMSKDDMVKATLCNEGANGKHNVECLKRTCEICGVDKIDDLYKDLDLTCTVEWFQWENIIIGNEMGKHCMSCVVKKTTLGEMLDVFKTNLKTYPEHKFRAEWQHEMMKKCQDNLKPGQVMTVMDFSENYNCKFQNEVQNAFFDQNQVTVHPVMAYYKKDDNLIKHSIIVISSDTKHDSHSVNSFRKAVLHKLSDTTEVQEVIEWTDGCAAQYKGRASFADITLSTLPMPLVRNFFETSHGKSVCDGIGAIAKNYCSRAVLSGKAVLGTADQVYEFLRKNLTKSEETSQREFIFVKDIDRNRPEVEVDTVKGTRKFHCVRQKEPYVMLSRNLSCFCDYCLTGDFLQCSNIQYVEEWQEQRIQKISDKKGKGGRQSNKKGNMSKDSCQTIKCTENTGVASQSVDVHVGQYVEVEIKGKKSKQMFFAQVTDKDGEEIEVSFMQKKGILYYWPDSQERTWELMSSIKKVLPSPEMSEKSTNDRHYFYFNQ